MYALDFGSLGSGFNGHVLTMYDLGFGGRGLGVLGFDVLGLRLGKLKLGFIKHIINNFYTS